MEFFGPYSNSDVRDMLLSSLYGADTHRRSQPAEEVAEEEEELDGYIMVNRQMGEQTKTAPASYESKNGAFPIAITAAAVDAAVERSARGYRKEGSRTAGAPSLCPAPTTETPEDEKVSDPDVWKRTPEEEERLYKVLNGPIPSPPASTTFAWPPTEEEEAVIQRALYGRRDGRRLPVFSQICPEVHHAAAAPSPMQSCMRKK